MNAIFVRAVRVTWRSVYLYDSIDIESDTKSVFYENQKHFCLSFK